MATHRFAVGQQVRFSPVRGQEQEHTRGALFKIVRLLPEAGKRTSVPRQERDRRSGAGRPRRPSYTSVTVEMPTIVLKLTRTPLDTSVKQTPQTAGPLLRGTGDTDYLCGNCGFVIWGIGPEQRVAVDTATCSACGAENEFPPELRS